MIHEDKPFALLNFESQNLSTLHRVLHRQPPVKRNMSTPPNRRLHEDSGSGSVSGDHRHPSDMTYGHDDQGTDSGVGHESRDAERRSTLNDLHSNLVGSETRVEFRGSKDSIKYIKVKNREMKSESRELQQTAKCDKYYCRADENKDSKPEIVTYSEPKGNGKLDKDGCDGKEGLQADNADIAGKSIKKESSTLEPKKKDHDTWKDVDREARDVKKEWDADEELERPGKRSRCHKKKKKGKVGVSCVASKIGERMQELIKLWKEYELLQADKACGGSQNGPTLEIRIPAKQVTSTNRQVRNEQLWGTDVYTVDSDLVAGYCRPNASPPPSATEELRATIRVLPPQDCYISTLRNNVQSRAWRAPIDCSYRVERCCFVKQGGGIIDLEPHFAHSSTMEPTFAPVVVEHKMNTRASASKVLRQKRFLSAVTFQYSFCMEPWYEYSINVVADQGLKTSLFTSACLKKGEVLYVETRSRRYELCFNGEKVIKAAPGRHALDSESSVVDVFRWSRCKRFLTQKDMLSVGIPLPLEYVEVLEKNLDWEDDVLWSHTGVFISGREYRLARALFLSPN